MKDMKELKGSQKKFLRGLAHNLNPAAFIGQKGITEILLKEIDMALKATELIKVKFNDYKEKDIKNSLTEEIAKATGSHIAGMVGHVLILYRQNTDVEKQLIRLP